MANKLYSGTLLQYGGQFRLLLENATEGTYDGTKYGWFVHRISRLSKNDITIEDNATVFKYYSVLVKHV